MLTRCYNTRRKEYPRYGGRGIKMCERWRTSFQNFLADMGPRPGDGYTIERKNNNGDYEPGNCVWATWKRQQRNRSNNRLLAFKGEIHSVAEWSDKLGISYSTLVQRLNKHWTIEKALTTPGRVNPADLLASS